MTGSPVSVRNYSQGLSCVKELQGSKHKGFSEHRRVSQHPIITRATRDEGMNGNCRSLSIGVDGGSESKKRWAQVLERTSQSIFGIFWCNKRSSGVRGSPGGSHCENLALELVKSFNPNRREIRVPEYRRGIKDPNTTQWQRGPVSHTAMLVKVFVVTRHNFGQGVGKGASYRQLALIPTCDAPDLTVH